jgi:ankyrin repeat protein
MERIGRQVKDQEELAKQVLSWITCARRPLTTSELQHALAVEVGEFTLDEENLPQIEDIVSVCAGLVVVDKESNIIRLVHYTTQEYFKRTQNYWFPNAETDITTICVTYLSFDIFNSGFCQTDAEFEERLRLNALYDYVAHNWGSHAREALTLCQEVISFLESKLKIEAASQALLAIRKYSSRSKDSQKVPRQITGLHLAAYFGVLEAANTLIRRGQSLDSKDSYNGTPLLWAAENGHEAVVKLLLDNGAKLESKYGSGGTPLLWAAKNGHKAVVKLLLDNSAELESKDYYGGTPLSWAATNGHEVVVKLLLDKSAKLETKDKYSQTPLSCAVENGHEAVVKLLLDRGAELECIDTFFAQTPLTYAAEKGDEAIVKLLLDKGAEPETKFSCGRTPLSYAVLNGHKGVVKLLLEKGAELEIKYYGRTPLSCAAEQGDEAIVKLLLDKGAELETKDWNSQTPLSWAIKNGHDAVVKLLLEKGALKS